MQFFYHFAVHLWHYYGPLLHPFHHQHFFLPQKTVAVSFLAGRRLFKACLANVCAFALTALWFQHSQMKPTFHHLLPDAVTKNMIAIFVVLL
jgi:hypothetical protein